MFTLHNRHVKDTITTTCSLSCRLYFNCYIVTSPLLWPQSEDISDTTRDGGSLIFLTEHFHGGKVPSGRSAFEGSRNTGNILRSKQTIEIRLVATGSGKFKWKLLGMETNMSRPSDYYDHVAHYYRHHRNSRCNELMTLPQTKGRTHRTFTERTDAGKTSKILI